MMKTQILTVVLLLIITSAFAQQVEPDLKLTKQWETGPGLKIPESVLYDTITDIIYVSNIDGSPGYKDSTGFISTLSADGTMLKADWVTGIDAPKGMGILNNHLFVSNITEVIEIDIPTATIIKRYPVEGANFLNDIAIDPKTGMVFITDSSTGQVYILLNGVVTSWLKGDMFKGANGLCLSGNLLYIGTGNSILRANIVSGEVTVAIPGTGGVDGLFVTSDNNFIFSDFKGSVFIGNAKRKPELMLNTTQQKMNAADFGVVVSKNMILIPTFANNKVVCYTSATIK
jgi:DNA-binding beta-propeller fold protein YncE